MSARPLAIRDVMDAHVARGGFWEPWTDETGCDHLAAAYADGWANVFEVGRFTDEDAALIAHDIGLDDLAGTLTARERAALRWFNDVEAVCGKQTGGAPGEGAVG